MRLFDLNGSELANDATDSVYGGPEIASFRLPSSGDYYIGVSGYPNTAYNPSVANSGVPGNYYGYYSISVELRDAAPSLWVQSQEASSDYLLAEGELQAGMFSDMGDAPEEYVQAALTTYQDAFLPQVTTPPPVPFDVALIDNQNGFVLQTTSDAEGQYDIFLAPSTPYTVADRLRTEFGPVRNC